MRTIASVLLTVFQTVLCVLASMVSLGLRWDHKKAAGLTSNPVLDGIGVLLLLVPVAGVALRHRWPGAITALSVVAAVGARLDTTLGLIAFTSVVRRTRSVRDRRTWILAAALAGATVLALVRDANQASSGNSVIGLFLAGDGAPPSHVPWVAAVLLGLALTGAPLAVGLGLRAHDGEKEARGRAEQAGEAARRAELEVREQEQASLALAATVDLQAERERVAREVHDGLGHRLSLLALHAGALERGLAGAAVPGTEGEDRTRETARLVRQEAQGAMGDLRSLLAVLREPVGTVEPAPRLEDLREVVDGVLAAELPLSSSIYLERAAEADEVLSRAVYRIVQESLTNARKHAPASPVRLRVEGGPTTGITIACTNRLPADGAAAPHGVAAPPGGARSAASSTLGSGSGLRGMARRAEICGGTLRAGPDGRGGFTVACHLPWRGVHRGPHGAGPPTGPTGPGPALSPQGP